METRIIEKQEYDQIMCNSTMIYHTSAFNELNVDKVEQFFYVAVYKDASPRFAFPVGIKDKQVLCPFSAPFSFPECTKLRVGINDFEEAEVSFTNFFDEMGMKQIKFVFPPDFYDLTTLAAWENVFSRNDWHVEYVDLNYSLDLREIRKNGYDSVIDRNAKRNLRLADKAGLSFVRCVSMEEKEAAYMVIKANREAKGFPLRMTWNQVSKTIGVVKSDMYLVRTEETNIAAALVYEINDKIVQVIYWGDIPGYSEKKSINFLARELVQLYMERGFDILDIGPSTEFGIPNYGLCSFKESVGCLRTTKKTWSKKLGAR